MIPLFRCFWVGESDSDFSCTIWHKGHPHSGVKFNISGNGNHIICFWFSVFLNSIMSTIWVKILSFRDAEWHEHSNTPKILQRKGWAAGLYDVLVSPLRSGKIWEQLSHTCFSFSATTCASFVALTLVVGCICMALLFFSEITIAASFRDPAAIAVTLVVSVAASS